MNTEEFVLRCIGCYKSACIYLDDLCEAFDIEITEDDVREVFRNADFSRPQLGNALISRCFDKIVAKAQEAHPRMCGRTTRPIRLRLQRLRKQP